MGRRGRQTFCRIPGTRQSGKDERHREEQGATAQVTVGEISSEEIAKKKPRNARFFLVILSDSEGSCFKKGFLATLGMTSQSGNDKQVSGW